MAGHNKWSKIKRQKAATDSKRSRSWAIVSREISVAAREGGGDPSMNAKLALAVQKAKRENMPKDNIERAIRRGTGEIAGQHYEEHTYEGYAPHGVAVFVEALTDNTNRTVSALRSMFSKAGGSLGKSGSVAYIFDRKGLLQVEEGGSADVLELAIEAGAEDVEEDGDTLQVVTPLEVFEQVQATFNAANVGVVDARLVHLARSTVTLGTTQAARVQRLLDQIEEHQDVRAVYSNLELP